MHMHVHLQTATFAVLGDEPFHELHTEAPMPHEIRNGCSAELIDQSAWRKSSYSGNMGNCVEVAPLADGSVALRNSRFPTGPALLFTPNEWSAFIAGAHDGEFDSTEV